MFTIGKCFRLYHTLRGGQEYELIFFTGWWLNASNKYQSFILWFTTPFFWPTLSFTFLLFTFILNFFLVFSLLFLFSTYFFLLHYCYLASSSDNKFPDSYYIGSFPWISHWYFQHLGRCFASCSFQHWSHLRFVTYL